VIVLHATQVVKKDAGEKDLKIVRNSVKSIVHLNVLKVDALAQDHESVVIYFVLEAVLDQLKRTV
jgi:hypothetical protein